MVCYHKRHPGTRTAKETDSVGFGATVRWKIQESRGNKRARAGLGQGVVHPERVALKWALWRETCVATSQTCQTTEARNVAPNGGSFQGSSRTRARACC